MRLEFHRQVASDISHITDYYEDVAGPQLANEFYAELRLFFQKAADHPESFSKGRSQTSEPRKVSLPFSFSHS
jgi:plasmid stabilization system protein ParE